LPRRLVLASRNRGKLAELKILLAGLPFEPIPQTELGISDIEETGASFLDNALLKARHAAAISACAALADDSGLEVAALHGAPGIYSARYAGRGASDAANNAKLVAALRAAAVTDARAQYRCVLAFVRSSDDTAPLIAEGIWQGRIVLEPRGTGGFGYDPHFLLPEFGLTVAELDAARKNALSHRAQALRMLRAQLAAIA
jgi:XTP/dITP diphosphohydrolase